jgi:uncharacterized membrane protein
MADYKTRLQRDLDGWIAAGLVPAESREPILDTVPDAPRVEASTALAVVGALLLGIAAIAFVAANWSEIPRIGRFALILGLFLGVAGGAAWAGRSGARPVLTNTLLTVAALIYAAAIGLTGQIFDIAGDPQRALRGAGLAAGLLALAGRSSGAGIAALALVGLGDFAGDDRSRWLVFAAPAGLALAWFWRSRPLAHAASLALIVGALAAISEWGLDRDGRDFLIGAGVLAALAGLARHAAARPEAKIAFLWFVWGALLHFGLGGFGDHDQAFTAVHRAAWLALSAGVVALGAHDRQGVVTAAGVVSMAAAVCAILFDLGFGLMAAAGLFAACAVAALAVALVVRGRRARR